MAISKNRMEFLIQKKDPTSGGAFLYGLETMTIFSTFSGSGLYLHLLNESYKDLIQGFRYQD